LLKSASFDRVFRRSQRSRDRLFTVLYRESREDAARLGLAVSKKHSRKATARNRIKRIVRESFRQHQGQLTGLDVVVMSQPDTEAATNRELFDSLAAHWRRCGRAARPQQESE
jgi:ribonuclease P protein component